MSRSIGIVRLSNSTSCLSFRDSRSFEFVRIDQVGNTSCFTGLGSVLRR